MLDLDGTCHQEVFPKENKSCGSDSLLRTKCFEKCTQPHDYLATLADAGLWKFGFIRYKDKACGMAALNHEHACVVHWSPES